MLQPIILIFNKLNIKNRNCLPVLPFWALSIEGDVSPLRVVVVPEFPEKLPPFGHGPRVPAPPGCGYFPGALLSGRPLAPQCSGLRERRGLSPCRATFSPRRPAPFIAITAGLCRPTGKKHDRTQPRVRGFLRANRRNIYAPVAERGTPGARQRAVCRVPLITGQPLPGAPS